MGSSFSYVTSSLLKAPSQRPQTHQRDCGVARFEAQAREARSGSTRKPGVQRHPRQSNL